MVLRAATKLQFHVARLERGGGAPIEEARIVLVFVGFDGASHWLAHDSANDDLLASPTRPTATCALAILESAARLSRGGGDRPWRRGGRRGASREASIRGPSARATASPFALPAVGRAGDGHLAGDALDGSRARLSGVPAARAGASLIVLVDEQWRCSGSSPPLQSRTKRLEDPPHPPPSSSAQGRHQAGLGVRVGVGVGVGPAVGRSGPSVSDGVLGGPRRSRRSRRSRRGRGRAR